MAREDPLAALVALGGAPRGSSFGSLLAEARVHLERLSSFMCMNAQALGADQVPLGLYSHALPDVTLRDYVAEYRKTDPMTPTALLRDGRANTLSEAAPRELILQTPFFNDCCGPAGIWHIVGVTCALPAGGTFMLAAHRGRRVSDFGRRDVARWGLAGAEIARAVAALAFREHPGEATKGVLLFDRRAQLVHADEGGGALFARLVGEQRGPWLASLVREVATVPARRADRLASVACGPGAQLHLRLSVAHGLGAGGTVVVGLSVEQDPAERVRDAARVAGLSPRESAVAALVSRGLSNREIAAALGIRPVTVRDHLRRAFVALGVSTRTELVTRLLSGP